MKADAQLKEDVIEELQMVRHVRGVTGRQPRRPVWPACRAIW